MFSKLFSISNHRQPLTLMLTRPSTSLESDGWLCFALLSSDPEHLGAIEVIITIVVKT